ncbi:MAG: inorganic phosphate transporter [Desulfurococcaceae archaeon]
MEYTLLITGFIGAILLAWINGANNAGNAIGSAIGSKAISIKKALWLASLFELLGGVLFGHFVSLTLLRGLFDINLINDPKTSLIGLNIAIFATVAWVFLATLFRVPMSISQAIVGGMLGFGLATIGLERINWFKVGEIVASWIYLPFLSMAISVFLYKLFVKLTVSINWFKLSILFLSFCYINIFSATLLLMAKSIKLLELRNSIIYSAIISTLLTLAMYIPITRIKFKSLAEAKEKMFRLLLLISCLSMAFSHGANDVANSAGPLSGIIYLVNEEKIPETASIPIIPLLVSSIAISLGVLLWGYRVAETIGEKITTLTVETGFIAQFSGSITVLIVTRLGLPVSTTVAIVGSIGGVGLARGLRYVNLKTLFKIILTWFIGFPTIMVLSYIGVKVYNMLS